jgi:hypothetical protein
VATVLFDPGFGVTLPRALRQLGAEAVAHAEHFRAGTPDAEWLAAAAERGWIVVTGDRRADRIPAVRERLRASGAACFVLAVGRRPRLEQAALIGRLWARMQQIAEGTPRPFVCVLRADGAPPGSGTRRTGAAARPSRRRGARLQPPLPGLLE